MSNIPVEELVQRIEALERAVGVGSEHANASGWKSVVGMFDGSEFMKQVDEEGRKMREAERIQAKQEAAAE